MAETTKEMPKSSLSGEVEVEVDIKSPAAKFYNVYAGRPDHVAKATSRKVQACDLLEGEWGTVGSIVNWKYVYAGKAKVAKERIEVVEREKKLIKFRVIEGDVLAVYKSFLITIQVTAKEGDVGSMVKWHLEYERNDEKVPLQEIRVLIAQNYSVFYISAIIEYRETLDSVSQKVNAMVS